MAPGAQVRSARAEAGSDFWGSCRLALALIAGVCAHVSPKVKTYICACTCGASLRRRRQQLFVLQLQLYLMLPSSSCFHQGNQLLAILEVSC